MARSFRSIVLGSVIALASIGAAFGQANTAPTDYREMLKACGAEWRASDTRKAVAKGDGAKAWQEFRAKCVRDKGWNGPTRGKKGVTA